MRVATKYPQIATRHFERTGRQAEIVEVKGSVELAPLTGLAEGIVDLTATGTTLRENGLVVREEILASTARLIANPVAHKLHAAAIDDVVARMREALGWLSGSPSPPTDAAAIAAHVRALVPAPAVGPRGVAGIVASVEEGGDAALLDARAPFGGGDRRRCACPTTSCDAALDALDPAVRAGLELARANVARGRRGRAGRGPRRRAARRASACGCASCRSRAPRSTRPAAARRIRRSVVMGVVTARAAGRGRGRASPRPAHPVILAACALCGVDEVYRMGGAQAIAALASAPRRSGPST